LRPRQHPRDIRRAQRADHLPTATMFARADTACALGLAQTVGAITTCHV
jgi:hypothetical protein